LTHKADIRPFRGIRPTIAASAYIDRSSVIIGDVHIGEDSSVWPLCVIRGDVDKIRIGARTNIQDGSILHVMRNEWPLHIGDEVTIGHSVTLHGCSIESLCLIGMGAIILNGAVVGTGSIIAAGTLIPERTVIPPGSVVMGSPGKVKREMADAMHASIRDYADRYVEYKNVYREEPAE
jgi:gamma-carbonic anhydrase